MPYKYIGKTTSFKGKRLWEIVGNLKNYGVGRVVVRSQFERYPEPSFFKIKAVEALPNPENPTWDNARRVKVSVEKTFRGNREPDTIILRASYKPDFRLLSKDEEAAYCKITAVHGNDKLYAKTMSFPPLMKEMIINEAKMKGEELKEEPRLVIKYAHPELIKIAEDGENADEEVVYGLGIPAHTSLYKGIDLNKKL